MMPRIRSRFVTSLAAATMFFGLYCFYQSSVHSHKMNHIQASYELFNGAVNASNECKFFMDPFDPKISYYIEPPHEPAECVPLQTQYVTLKNGSLTLSDSAGVRCSYSHFTHNSGVDDFSVRYSEQWHAIPDGGAMLTSDFTDVSCRNKIGIESFRLQFASVVAKNASIETGRPFKDESEEHLSVVLLGFDGLSRSNYLRQMPQSKRQMDDLGFVLFDKYVKIADNTFPNWMGVFLGEHTYDYEFPATVDNRDGIAYDNWTQLLWRRFGSNGYATLFAEDMPRIATFNYDGRVKGFVERPPADHYMRPFFLALEDHLLRSRSDRFCYDAIPIHRIQFDYVESFLNSYAGKRRFAFNWQIEASHDYLNDVGVLDGDFAAFLKRNERHFNKSVVVVFSDHGNRYDKIRETVIGRLESRLPLFSIRVPQWLQIKQPELWRHLQENSKRLTTHFDLHATLVQVMMGLESSTPGKMPKLPRGSSVFTPISINRTCFLAEIPSMFCPCFPEVDLDPAVGNELAVLILKKINQLFTKHSVEDKCAPMTLATVKSVSLSLPPAKMVIDDGQPSIAADLFHYRVEFTVQKPSGALLEGVVVKNRITGNTDVLNDIERNNRYGNTSHCVNDALLKKLCHCL